MNSERIVLYKNQGSGQRRIQIKLNGSNHEVTGPISVARLILSLDLDARKVAVERNLEIVSRSVYEQTMIEEGDRLEIVQVIGGG